MGIVDRAQSWVDANVSYSQTARYKNQYGSYRRDCSGFVSMALGLDEPGLPTANLLGKSEKISKGDLKLGDILLRHSGGTDGHAVLFEDWSKDDKSEYWGYEMSPSGIHHRKIPYPYFSGHRPGDFTPRRLKSGAGIGSDVPSYPKVMKEGTNYKYPILGKNAPGDTEYRMWSMLQYGEESDPDPESVWDNTSLHWALDIGCPRFTNCYSAWDAVVLGYRDNVPVGQSGGSGSPANWILLGVHITDPKTDKTRKASVLFYHLASVADKIKNAKLRKDVIETGAFIGKTDNTGNSSDDHLHFHAFWGWGDSGSLFSNQTAPDKRIWPPQNSWVFDYEGPGDVSADEEGTAADSIYLEGDFEKVLKAFDLNELRKAKFNPPLPRRYSTGTYFSPTNANKPGSWANINTLLALSNRVGWIVRDPILKKQIATWEESDDDGDIDTTPVPENPTQADAAEAIPETDWGGYNGPPDVRAMVEREENPNGASGKKPRNGDPEEEEDKDERPEKAKSTWTQDYGFRFLYNPETWSESYKSIAGANPQAVMDALAIGSAAAVGTSGSEFSFELMLYRKLDVEFLRANYREGMTYQELADTVNAKEYYEIPLTAEDAQGLLTRGTMYDIEYLFRLANGDPQDTWTGQTSDWGMLLPSMVTVSLGDGPGRPRRLRGMLAGLSFKHELFATGMIPVYTTLSLNFPRVVDSYYYNWEAAGSADDGGNDDDGGNNGDSGDEDEGKGKGKGKTNLDKQSDDVNDWPLWPDAWGQPPDWIPTHFFPLDPFL